MIVHKHRKSLFMLAAIVLVILSCEKIMPKAPQPDQVMNAPVEGLTEQQKRIFLDGAEEFDEVYTQATGLGPIFVASSCAGCHSGNNRGHPFTNLVRFGQSDTNGNTFLAFGAPQIQPHFIPGHTGETIPAGATSATFIAPIVSGTGFLELVSDQDVLAMADPNDLDGDGISGRPNWITLPNWVVPMNNAVSQNGKYIGRFGRKASEYNLHHQTVAAFNNDIGITTTYMPNNPFNYLQGTQPVQTSDPDISDQSVNATVFYLQALQAPIQRNQQDDQVKLGASVFKQIDCNRCHKEELHTGFSPIAALSNTSFHPYTDLLLHDMGPGLDDHYTEGTALTAEWRTTPLWGLGLAADVQGGRYFLMHDGRAKSIEEAIEMHGGESLQSRQKYQQLSASDKSALIAFLKSL